MIIVGLGPAGAYLGHRAYARGLKVIGVDHSDTWTATYGGWVDELPRVPFHRVVKPSVRFGGLGRVIDRDYAIIDATTWRQELLDFPTVTGHAEIASANRVLIDGRPHLTDVIIDARGLTYTAGTPVQQALGWFIDDAPDAWMDFAGDTFLYSMPTPRGHLVEETYLATDNLHEWSDLEQRLRQRFPDAEPTGVERVLITLGGHDHCGPALPYGARAGFVSPITGYSVSTSIKMAEPTLDALWSGGQLPWRTRTFRSDRWLAERLQRVLLALPAEGLHQLLRALLTLPAELQRRFLALGDLAGTLACMPLVFAQVDNRTKAHILRALAC